MKAQIKNSISGGTYIRRTPTHSKPFSYLGLLSDSFLVTSEIN
jgi:hypothetical protein